MIAILNYLAYIPVIPLMGIVIFIDYTYFLHMFQLNSYFPGRYNTWARQNRDKIRHHLPLAFKVIFALWVLAGLVLVGPGFHLRGSLVANLGLILGHLLLAAGLVQYQKTKAKAKKPLVYTHRVYRLLWVGFGLWLALALALYGLGLGRGQNPYQLENFLLAAILTGTMIKVLTQYLVYLAYYLLRPLEAYLSQKYYNQAKQVLDSQSHLIRIGITGSYGKTSTKFILENVLKSHYLTLVTPHSYNTTLGVVRTVREGFSGSLEAFVAEMGAKKSGDIKEICDLVEPQIGIITAIGPQHLESFGTIENVIATKFELARAVGHRGVVIVNYDDENVRKGMALNPGLAYITYGQDDQADAVISNIQVSEKGSGFTLTYRGQSMDYLTPLLGVHNISNLAAGIVLGLYLDIPPAKIAMGIRETQPVEHRLELKMQGNYYILDDAFNSNPVGANNALEVLKSFPRGKKVVMTPGMIELGSQDEPVHFALGQHMAACVDVAILVGEKKTEKIKEGLLAKGFGPENIITVASVFAGFAAAREIMGPGDILLIENDLPDNY